MNMDQADLEKRIDAIEARNRRVEADKAWEVSFTRKAFIMLVTYVIAGAVFMAIGNDHPWRNAWIPTVAFFLSTQSLPFVKAWWTGRYIHKS